MAIKRIGLLTTLLFVFTTELFSQQYAGHPLVKNYAVKELGPSVYNIIQDDRGVMYFAMGKGVVEYDGHYWREIPLPSKVQAYSFAQSKEGIIYVAGVGHFGYLTLNAQGKTVFEDLTPLVKNKTIIGDVFSVRNTSKFVYFHTVTHLFQYDKDKQEIITFDGKKYGFTVGNFVMDDTYFFNGIERGLLKIENNQIVKAPHSDFFSDQDKTQFLFGASPFDAQTQLIIGYNPNIYLYSTSATAPKSLQLSSQDFLQDNFLYTSTSTQNGRYHLLGSIGKGGILIDKQGKIVQQYNTQAGVDVDEILHVYNDKQQNFWLGLNNGLNKTEHSLDLTHWSRPYHYKGDIFYIYLHQAKLYVLTSKEIFVISPDKKITMLKGGATHFQKWGMELFHYGDADKPIFAAGGSLYEIAADKVIEIYSTKTGHSKFFVHTSKKYPNRIISTEGNALVSLRYEKNRWVEEGVWKGMERDDFRKITETKEGDIWLGTHTSGIVKVIPNFKNITQPLKVVYYGIEQGLPSLNRCVPFVYKGNILIGTEKGLYIYVSQKDRFEPYCELGKQFCDGSMGVYHFVESADNKIYIAPFKGHASCVTLEKNGVVKWIFEPFRRMPSMQIDKIEVDATGVVWIGGGEGIFRYDARQDTKEYKQSFSCLIRKVSIDKDSVLFWGNDSQKPKQQNFPLKLPYQYHDIKFEFAAPFFDQEDKTLYSYYLDGYDKNWSDWSTQTEKEYTNLWEGTYTFRAKAKNIYGVESTVGTYLLTVLPPWYRTWWAVMLYLACALAAIVAVFKVYHYRLIKKKLWLQKLVKERTIQLKEQNSELHNKQEKLEIQAKTLTQVIQTKDKLFAILGHDLRAPINSLAGLMDLVSQKSISPQILQMYTDKLKINVKQVHFTLNNLLFWATGQMQGLHANPKLFSLHSLVESNFSSMQEISLSKRILLTNLVKENISINADKDQIEIVIRNLLSNALKFTRKDGEISVHAISKEAYVEISIKDNGIGMAASDLNNLFKANTNYSHVGTDGEKGTGLGLMICKELIELNGGKIWVVSEVGKGTEICFTLPILTNKN